MSNMRRKLNSETKELIKNVDKVSDWIYQRKEFDHSILIRIFNQLLQFLGNLSQNSDGSDEMQSRIDTFRIKFTELTAAYEAGDFILTADIMHHEFAEYLLQGKEKEIVPATVRPVTADIEMENRRGFLERYGLELPIMMKEGTNFSTGQAIDGSRILYVEENGSRIRMNSFYDPTHEAVRWADKYKDMPNTKTTIVMQGLLNGFFLRALRLNMRTNVDFIVYEPSQEMFLFVCQNFNLVDIFEDQRVNLILPFMEEDQFYKELYGATGGAKSHIIAVVTPGYTKDVKFTDICEQIRTVEEAETGFRIHFGKQAFWNTLYAFSSLNRNYLVYDFIQAFPKEIPIFMISGGPSLLKNVQELKRVKGKGLIVAIERAVSVLLDNGIVPDIMVTIDPIKDPGFLDYEEVINAYLLCGYGANREAMEPHNGHLIFMHSDVHYNELPGLNGRLLNFGDIGGGVAPAAFIHFLYGKFHNLVLVGQDLAISGTMTHADGRNDPIISDMLFDVEGIDGGTVKSRWDFDRFRNFMERKMREYPDTVVTDATEGGALIHGTRVRTLRETVDELCTEERDIAGILSSMPHAQTDEQHDETVTYMCLRLKELRDIKSICPQLEDISRKLVNECKHGDIGSKKSLRRIDQFNQLRNRLYGMKANDWLEETWVTDRYSIPDAYIVVRANEEAYPVFREAQKYYAKLPEYCDSLGWLVKEVFGFSEEDYERRVADVQAG